MNTATDQGVIPAFGTLSREDRDGIRAGRRSARILYRGHSFTVHVAAQSVFVTNNGHGGENDVAGGAAFDTEATASAHLHHYVGALIRDDAAHPERNDDFFGRAWSACDGLIAVEHEPYNNRWHVVVGDQLPFVHTRHTAAGDLAAGWQFVEGTLAAVGIDLDETALSEHRDADLLQAAAELDPQHRGAANDPQPEPHRCAEPTFTGWRAALWRIIRSRRA